MVRLRHVSQLRCCDAFLVDLYYSFKLLAQSGVGFHATFKYQIKHQEGNKKSSLDHKLAELLLHLKAVTYINNIFRIYCVDVHIS